MFVLGSSRAETEEGQHQLRPKIVGQRSSQSTGIGTCHRYLTWKAEHNYHIPVLAPAYPVSTGSITRTSVLAMRLPGMAPKALRSGEVT